MWAASLSSAAVQTPRDFSTQLCQNVAYKCCSRLVVSSRSIAIAVSGSAANALFGAQTLRWPKRRELMISAYAARNTVDLARPVDLCGATFAEPLLLLGARLSAR